MKNHHMIYAYSEMDKKPGKYVLIIGITEIGFTYLKTDGMTLTIDALPNLHFENVIMFKEKDKETLKRRLRETGVQVFERN